MGCRKIAVPVPDDATWKDFVQQVIFTFFRVGGGFVWQKRVFRLPALSCEHDTGVILQVQSKLKLSGIDSIYLVAVSIPAATAHDRPRSAGALTVPACSEALR